MLYTISSIICHHISYCIGLFQTSNLYCPPLQYREVRFSECINHKGFLYISLLIKSSFLILTVVGFRNTAYETKVDDNHNLITDSYFSLLIKNATHYRNFRSPRIKIKHEPIIPLCRNNYS